MGESGILDGVSLTLHSYEQGQTALFNVLHNGQPLLTELGDPLLVELGKSPMSCYPFKLSPYIVSNHNGKWYELYYYRLPEPQFHVMCALLELAHNNNLHPMFKD